MKPDYRCQHCEYAYKPYSWLFEEILPNFLKRCRQCKRSRGRKYVVTNKDTPPVLDHYPALIMIAGFYQIFAFVVGGVAIVSFLIGIALIVTQNVLGAIFLLGSLIIGTIGVISMFAISEGIMLFVNMANDLSKIKGMGANRSDSVEKQPRGNDRG